MSKSIAGIALHLLLILALLLESGPWPAAAGAWAADHAQADRMACAEGTSMPPAPDDDPSSCERGCCPQPTCDVSACIAAASLPRMERTTASPAPVPTRFPWSVRGIAPPSIDALLRPPIA